MKLTFAYSKQKDIWCLMNYGKGSMNSNTPTKVYEKLVSLHGENPSEEKVSEFIDSHVKENNIDIQKYIADYQGEWDQIANAYYKKAEDTFGVKLENDVTVYLSINNRCPYSITESHFFVSIPAYSMRKTVMHELWHFYTWYKFGSQQDALGKQKYNEVKEALTVLLNVEFKDLLGDIQDSGYPQHQELRSKILDIWNKDIDKLWNQITIVKNTEKAFHWIIGILEQNNIPYKKISGGFAARVHGVKRELADIDIEVSEKDMSIIADEAKKHISYPLQRYIDDNWNLMLMTLSYEGQDIDIASTEAEIYNKGSNQWEQIGGTIDNGILVEIYGKKVNIDSVDSLIAYKTKLGRDVDIEDVRQLTILVNK